MKILFIIGSLAVGGKQRRLVRLIQNLQTKEDFKITLVIRKNYIHYKEIFDTKINLITLVEKDERKLFKVFKQLYSLTKSLKPDIIHTWGSIDSFYAVLLGKLFKIKVINSEITYGFNSNSSKFGAIIRKFNFFLSDKIMANSYAGLNYTKAPVSKSQVIYNGICLNDFDLSSTESVLDIDINENKTNIIMVGRFVEAKDYETFIKVASSILAKNQQVSFFCVGHGPNLESIKQKANKYNNNGIYFLGIRNDIPSLLAKMNIALLLNNIGCGEGISNAIMEYMSASLPVIATKAGGTPEIVQDSVSGFLVLALDSRVIEEKVTYLINNPEVAKRMGKRGRKIIEDNFNIELMTSQFIEAYELITS